MLRFFYGTIFEGTYLYRDFLSVWTVYDERYELHSISLVASDSPFVLPMPHLAS